jgi:hypothetical protein
MMLIVWTVILMMVLVSVLLIYMEHEWGFVLAGSTAVILVISYFSAELIMTSPLLVLLPQGSSSSRFDIMAMTAGALLVLALIVIAYLAGRSSASGKKR